MTFGAGVGVWVGHSLGATPLPMASTIACSGLAAAVLWLITRADRTVDRGDRRDSGIRFSGLSGRKPDQLTFLMELTMPASASALDFSPSGEPQ